MVQLQSSNNQICILKLHESAEEFLYAVTDISENYGIHFDHNCGECIANHFRKVDDLVKSGSDAAINHYINFLKRKTTILNNYKNSMVVGFKGLSLKRISQFEKFKADEQTIKDGCAICIDDIPMNKPMIRLDCKHNYCEKCICKWFKNNQSCPQCRRNFINI